MQRQLILIVNGAYSGRLPPAKARHPLGFVGHKALIVKIVEAALFNKLPKLEVEKKH